MIKITIAENKEKQGIRESLIKSYEILEEKFSQNNDKIKELEAELNGEDIKEKKSIRTIGKFVFLSFPVIFFHFLFL